MKTNFESKSFNCLSCSFKNNKIYKIFIMSGFKLFAFFLSLCTIIMLFIYPDIVSKSIIKGINICYNIIIPSLFPFTVMALFLSKSGILSIVGKPLTPITKKLFRLSGEETNVFILSFLAGFPVGAKLISQLYKNGRLSKYKAQQMLCYCVNAGPAFVVIAIGQGFLHSKRLGWILLFSQFFASIIIALFFRVFGKQDFIDENETNNNLGLCNSFVSATSDTCYSMLSICSFVILFSAISGIISALNINDNVTSLALCLTEVTAGCSHALVLGGIPLVSFVISWAGFSVQFQVLSTASELHVKWSFFVLWRAVAGIISYLTTVFLLKLFPQAMQTISNNVSYSVKTFSSGIYAVGGLIFLCVIFIFFLSDKKSGTFTKDML